MIRCLFVEGKGGFLNSDNVEQWRQEVLENSCFGWKSFVNGPLLIFNLCLSYFCVIDKLKSYAKKFVRKREVRVSSGS